MCSGVSVFCDLAYSRQPSLRRKRCRLLQSLSIATSARASPTLPTTILDHRMVCLPRLPSFSCCGSPLADFFGLGPCFWFLLHVLLKTMAKRSVWCVACSQTLGWSRFTGGLVWSSCARRWRAGVLARLLLALRGCLQLRVSAQTCNYSRTPNSSSSLLRCPVSCVLVCPSPGATQAQPAWQLGNRALPQRQMRLAQCRFSRGGELLSGKRAHRNHHHGSDCS